MSPNSKTFSLQIVLDFDFNLIGIVLFLSRVLWIHILNNLFWLTVLSINLLVDDFILVVLDVFVYRFVHSQVGSPCSHLQREVSLSLFVEYSHVFSSNTRIFCFEYSYYISLNTLILFYRIFVYFFRQILACTLAYWYSYVISFVNTRFFSKIVVDICRNLCVDLPVSFGIGRVLRCITHCRQVHLWYLPKEA